MKPARQPLLIELLATDDQRREADDLIGKAAKKPVTVSNHETFRKSLAPAEIVRPDDIEELIQDLRTPSLP